MIKIGDFARICNVSTQTLRYYDAEGILKADVVDSFSGYRFYSIDAVEKYKEIVFYKDLGFSLEEIKKIQSASREELRDIFQRKKEALSCAVDKYKLQIKMLDELCGDNKSFPDLSEIFLLPFENDSEVVGKWELCGGLRSGENLNDFYKINDEYIDKEIIFMPGGGFFWMYFWTRGILYRMSPKYKFAIPNSYSIVESDGVRFMMLQFMTDDCIDKGKDTVLLLYRQVDNIAYTEHTARLRIDKTDMPFVDDESVVGFWRCIDYIPNMSAFDIQKKYSEKADIFIESIHFLPRGICKRVLKTMSGNLKTEMLRYTKGFVINDTEMVAEEYKIKTICGRNILFVQHKSGDYFYGGRTPHLYVFEREE